jgi:hypothetical protein
VLRELPLADYDGERIRFRAIVSAIGQRLDDYGRPRESIQLSDVDQVGTGGPRVNDIWFSIGETWTGFKVGAVVEFTARVRWYPRWRDCYKPDELGDFKLTRPTRIVELIRHKRRSATGVTVSLIPKKTELTNERKTPNSNRKKRS